MPVTSKRKRKCQSCKKLFVPIHDTANRQQLVCSNECCIAYYQKQQPKGRKVARECASMVGKRSMGEVVFEQQCLTPMKAKSEYESDKFEYRVEDTRMYTPDFKITTKSGKVYYIEFKGRLDLRSRNIMRRVKHQYPELDIRFVFPKPQNKIKRGSKTTYGMWASQHGFPWALAKLPLKWQ